MVALLVGATQALAVPVPTNCSAGDAPAAYQGASCNGQCSTGGSLTYTCWPTGSSQGVEVYTVEDYAQTGDRTYSSWGTDGNGNTFCCFTDDPLHQISEVELSGTDLADELDLTYSTRTVTHADGTVNAYALGDNIVGSSAAGSEDLLNAGNGADTVVAYDGADTINGAGGGDTIDCGAGNDTVNAGAGDDTVDGGEGGDTLYGESDHDILRGQGGNDSIYGGFGADVLCGGATSGTGSDLLHAVEIGALEGGNDVDWMWEPQTSNQPSGGGAQSGDECGHSSHTSGWAGASCDYTNATRPADCYL